VVGPQPGKFLRAVGLFWPLACFWPSGRFLRSSWFYGEGTGIGRSLFFRGSRLLGSLDREHDGKGCALTGRGAGGYDAAMVMDDLTAMRQARAKAPGGLSGV